MWCAFFLLSEDENAGNYSLSTLQPLRTHLQAIKRTVNLGCLVPCLFEHDILKEDEIEKIHSVSSTGYKVMYLVQAIERKGKAGIRGLVHSLENEEEHLGHKELAEELKKSESVH